MPFTFHLPVDFYRARHLCNLDAPENNAPKKRQTEKTSPRQYKAGGNKTNQETYKYGLLPWLCVETILFLTISDGFPQAVTKLPCYSG
ncbi:hypothetical protein N7466_001533 [Penicillium verhagenii]|uniref:uncharacterized protein n=1 Tax=Penicillium verhagenii TaxID=1562060 RepID=UPI0025459B4F|nr:uncharacterized protein N7466_001533 [Penicillium verhagenii]KAJ5938399.1 hypothetical protein N7466_001533 [Penicillium verhagenii]